MFEKLILILLFFSIGSCSKNLEQLQQYSQNPSGSYITFTKLKIFHEEKYEKLSALLDDLNFQRSPNQKAWNELALFTHQVTEIAEAGSEITSHLRNNETPIDPSIFSTHLENSFRKFKTIQNINYLFMLSFGQFDKYVEKFGFVPHESLIELGEKFHLVSQNFRGISSTHLDLISLHDLKFRSYFEKSIDILDREIKELKDLILGFKKFDSQDKLIFYQKLFHNIAEKMASIDSLTKQVSEKYLLVKHEFEDNSKSFDYIPHLQEKIVNVLKNREEIPLLWDQEVKKFKFELGQTYYLIGNAYFHTLEKIDEKEYIKGFSHFKELLKQTQISENDVNEVLNSYSIKLKNHLLGFEEIAHQLKDDSRVESLINLKNEIALKNSLTGNLVNMVTSQIHFNLQELNATTYNLLKNSLEEFIPELYSNFEKLNHSFNSLKKELKVNTLKKIKLACGENLSKRQLASSSSQTAREDLLLYHMNVNMNNFTPLQKSSLSLMIASPNNSQCVVQSPQSTVKKIIENTFTYPELMALSDIISTQMDRYQKILSESFQFSGSQLIQATHLLARSLNLELHNRIEKNQLNEKFTKIIKSMLKETDDLKTKSIVRNLQLKLDQINSLHYMKFSSDKTEVFLLNKVWGSHYFYNFTKEQIKEHNQAMVGS
ncbi:MAG: hypothetical protein H6621_11915 [Halobacteriovoraceae bacterium]|nr:hypothetical protein [Halobacteriovoraceae bacterium]MCB9095767.1 hypothetical protein [Halobacteriovoraceae bacterium]